MFRFTQEPSSEIQSQCLAKITGMVPMCNSFYVILLSGIFQCAKNAVHLLQDAMPLTWTVWKYQASHVQRDEGLLPLRKSG